MTTYVNLNQFGFLSVTGRDAVKFLQGYTTCDLEKLDEAHFLMGAICNIQGRMLTSFLIIRIPDGLMLRMNASLVEPTLDFLSKYIVFSKAELKNCSETFRSYGIFSGGLETGSLRSTESGTEWYVQVDSDRQEYWCSIDTPPPAVTEKELDQWLLEDIRQGIAWVSPLTSEKFIPQMFNYHELDAIDFTKGCYLGQEIVARMQ